MTQKKLLIGSLANDLYRVATLTQRGSLKSAERFLVETKRWTTELAGENLKPYIQEILEKVKKLGNKRLDLELAEDCLLYAVRLQNYSKQLE